jgi:para-aminobenzoate synthetase/4-amino-4-deoxychorismate lyase
VEAAARLAALARLRCRARREPLGPGPAPEQVLRAASGADGLVGLVGVWAGGGAVVASDPLLVLPEGADPIAALGVGPVLGGASPEVVGGGWFGWLAYDGPSRLAFHDHVLRHADGQWWFEALWSAERDALLHARREEWLALLGDANRPAAGIGPAAGTHPAAGTGPASWRVGPFGGASRQRHLSAVERAVELIRAGELYQVNVCTRLAASFDGSAANLFADACASLRPVFGAFVEGDGRTLVSMSPELFLRRRGRQVRTAPIKGTWPDTAPGAASALRRSAKDAAENVMIVDLMRNDLGRVCETGSVRVRSLLDVERHPGVWHLVSTVDGTLTEGLTDDALLRAAFPPGSVTGAPKSRAVTAIGGLEAGPRGAYTGAIGFASPSWGAEFSVAIRTFEVTDGPASPDRRGPRRRIELGVGGGVTADSVPMLEWRECLDKAAPLLAALGAGLEPDAGLPDQGLPDQGLPDRGLPDEGLLETLLAVDGVVLRLADHLARLDRSCRELYGIPAPDGLAQRLTAAAGRTGGRQVVRLVVSPAAAVRVAVAPAPTPVSSSRLRTVRDRTGLWRHKWADRSRLSGEEARTRCEGADTEPLFVAPDGTVLETSRGNVFLLAEDGTLVTPPLRDDLLPGVTRRAVLDLARDAGHRTELRTFTVAELMAGAAFWTSSVSLAVPIHAVDGTASPRRDGDVSRVAAALLRTGQRTVR